MAVIMWVDQIEYCHRDWPADTSCRWNRCSVFITRPMWEPVDIC